MMVTAEDARCNAELFKKYNNTLETALEQLEQGIYDACAKGKYELLFALVDDLGNENDEIRDLALLVEEKLMKNGFAVVNTNSHLQVSWAPEDKGKS